MAVNLHSNFTRSAQAPTFINDPGKEPTENNVGKGINAGYHHFLRFPQCFLPFPKQNSFFWVTFILSSANVLNWTGLKFCHLVNC